MKIGINKIHRVPANKVTDYSFYPIGSLFNITPFLNGEVSEIPFTEGTALFEEVWSDEPGGKLSTITIEGINRVLTPGSTQTLLDSLYQDQILIITLKNGVIIIAGSAMYPCRFTFIDSIDGVSLHDKKFTYTCRSPHGSYFIKK